MGVRQRLGDRAADIAAGDDVPVIAEVGHHPGDQLGHRRGRHSRTGRREPVREPRQARHHDIDIDQQRQHPRKAQERVRPAVQQHHGRRIGTRDLVNGPDRRIAVGDHPRQRPQPILGRPPVVVLPRVQQLAEIAGIDTAVPADTRNQRDPAGRTQPGPEPLQPLDRNLCRHRIKSRFCHDHPSTRPGLTHRSGHPGQSREVRGQRPMRYRMWVAHGE